MQALTDIRAAVADDLAATDQLILRELTSDIPLIQVIVQHILKSGGKRLRPLLVVLSARACGYTGPNLHHELAAIIEFVHTATLLHDDVVDKSDRRRGRETANAVYGNQASVLVGDFLYSRAFQLLTRHSHVAIMQVLANTTNSIAEGEVLQLMNRNNADLTETDYLSVIKRKTADLFSAAAEIGALLGSEDPAIIQAMRHFGLHLGLGFQIIDDLLDYTADADQLGKNIGDDLAEGKATLPLIYALQHCDEDTAAKIRGAIKQGGREHLPEIFAAMQKTNAFEYTHAKAQQHAQQAKQTLAIVPDSEFKESLIGLVEFAIERDF